MAETALDLTTPTGPPTGPVCEPACEPAAVTAAAAEPPGSRGAARGTPRSATRTTARSALTVTAALAAPLRRPGTLLALLVLATALAWAFAPDLLAGHDPLKASPAHRLRPPSADAWFGTDYLGRDVYARVVHGASLSLRAPVIAVGLALVTGTALGLLAGVLGGWVDALLMRLVDVVLAVPGILLSLAVVTALGFGTVNVAVAVGVAGIAGFARISRAQVLKVRQEPFVQAAHAVGVGGLRSVVTHVLPHAAPPVLALAALELGTAVLAVSALSFLGLGAQPPTPEWGAMVAEGRTYLGTAWWLTALPGLVIAAVTLSVNRFARSATRRWTA
ncbi:ABC transporter permease [Kitasatospora sp. NBC_00458]|uniref:ABC transporter permease n=1 Tax=Kitasatospora sp. NBC_00458 TaxID=2903568 RepID=UPI002E19EA54